MVTEAQALEVERHQIAQRQPTTVRTEATYSPVN